MSLTLILPFDLFSDILLPYLIDDDNSFEECLKLLPENKRPECLIRVTRAFLQGHITIELAEFFIYSSSIEIPITTKMFAASVNGYLPVVKYLVEMKADIHDENDISLRWSSKEGHLETVKYLVGMKANIHAMDGLALKWASQNGHVDVVKYLRSCS